MDFATRKRLYNRCKPDEPLGPDDERNVAVDELGEELDLARGQNWVDELANKIRLSKGPVCFFFTGLPGTGKSTELLRLADRLASPEDARLLPVLVDAEETLDLANPISVFDIVIFALYHTERRVLEAEGKDPESALMEGYLSRIGYWLKETAVELSSLQVGAKGPGGVADAKAVLSISTNKSFREKARRRIGEHLNTFLENARAETRKFVERARQAGYPDILLIFDSLEKLRGTSDNWEEVLASAEKIFAGGAPYLQLPVHLVYTIPPALAWRLNVKYYFLPMFKIHTSKESADTLDPEGAGYQAALRLLEARLDESELQDVFGPSFPRRVEKLIEWSGGYPRDIVGLLQACVAKAPVSERAFHRILAQAEDDYRRTVPEEALPLLVDVRRDKHLPVSDENRKMVDLMLSNNVILRYQNDNEWFNLHPALRDWDRLKGDGKDD